jgi:hypothetical protein
MTHFDKHFTLQEANSLIPRLREIFLEIHNRIDEARSPRTTPPEEISPGRTNGHTRQPHRTREDILAEINNLITEITDQGIVIQDIQRGLVDFPAFIEGEEVFLCYELADGDEITAWHTLNAGYAGRKPLPEDLL